MLWDSVYDFFYNIIFHFGYLEDLGASGTIESFNIKIGDTIAIYDLSFDGYFSLIATIITMVIIVTLCCLFVKKIVSLVGGLIRQ